LKIALTVPEEGTIRPAGLGRERGLPVSISAPGVDSARRSNPGPVGVVIWNRPTAEYGRSSFGADYGLLIARWMEAN
jgi:hypothetical protein